MTKYFVIEDQDNVLNVPDILFLLNKKSIEPEVKEIDDAHQKLFIRAMIHPESVKPKKK